MFSSTLGLLLFFWRDMRFRPSVGPSRKMVPLIQMFHSGSSIATLHLTLKGQSSRSSTRKSRKCRNCYSTLTSPHMVRFTTSTNHNVPIPRTYNARCASHCTSDAMHKRGLCRRAVPVCLSVTFVYCVKTAKDTAKVAIECK